MGKDINGLQDSQSVAKEFSKLSKGLIPVVFVGRCVGLLSERNVLHDGKPQRITFLVIVTSILVAFLILNACLQLHRVLLQFEGDKAAIIRPDGFGVFAYSVSMLFTYAYQLVHCSQLPLIVQHVKTIMLESALAIEYQFARLPLTSNILLCISLFLGFSENIFHDIGRITQTAKEMHAKNASYLSLYYFRLFSHWHCIFSSYNAYATFFIIVFVKVCTWGWFYADMICIILCKIAYRMILSFKKSLFADLARVTSTTVKDTKSKVFVKRLSQHTIEATDSSFSLDYYHTEYLKLTELTIKMEKYIAPMILSNYACNIYGIVLLLFSWLGPFQKEALTTEQKFYVCYAFFQYCYKVAAVTYFVAEISQVSTSIKRGLQLCPMFAYSAAIQRLENMLTENPAGIYFFGTFLISRRFFVSILVFVFTTEIILLLTYAGYAYTIQ